jgi:hypothetical protein
VETGSAVEWAQFGLQVLAFVIGTGMSVLMFLVMIQFVRTFWNFYSEGRHGGLPSTRVLLRRIWCRHRILGRVKSRYGFHVTRCAACGVDVNRNRATELRR